MPSGNLKTESSRPSACLLEVGDWKLTEIKLAKDESRHQETQGGSGETGTNLREHCWLKVKNAAN